MEGKMNKAELVDFLSNKTQMPKRKCDAFLNEFKSAILEVCSKGGRINIRNFGKFEMQERKSRKIINPQTKRFYFCKPRKIINFKGYDNFRYAIK